MNASIAVHVATFGDAEEWPPHAYRALDSVYRQSLQPCTVTWVHAEDLHTARNVAAQADSRAEWLCFLDADDQLDDHYIEAMATHVATLNPDRDWLVQPATLGVHPDGHEDPEPVLIPRAPLIDRNFMVIGTLIHRAQFQRLGGFRDWPCYEDWDLWLRAWLDGAEFSACPEAIYRVGIRPTSRNNGARQQQLDTYHAIRNQYLAAATRR